MGTSDGFVLGRTKIVDHGSASLRFNIVIVGDGYTADQMELYAADVDRIVAYMRSQRPLDELWCGINVYRIDVSSLDSGADDPVTCPDGSTGSGAMPRTYFDASYCIGGVRRGLAVNNATVKSVAQTHVPEVHFMLCVVNSPISGGMGGEVATMDRRGADTAVHEMGHSVFGLADEYEYYRGCGSGETDHNHHPAVEPCEPNVTINTDPATIKWAAQLTNAADGLPTQTNPDCTKCLPDQSPGSSLYIGAFEGGHHHHCGVFRPRKNCMMRMGSAGAGFCAVCQQVIRASLAPYVTAESLTLTTPSIAFADIPEGVGGSGVTTWRAVVFEVVTCRLRTFRIAAGPTGGFGTPLGTATSVNEAHADPVAKARIWLSYTSTTAGATAVGSVTIRCEETGETWDIPIVANTVARQNAVIALVLDHSGSMSQDAGGGTNKIGKLREACNIFVSALSDRDAIGIVRFDDTAEIVLPLIMVGPPITGSGRIAAAGVINGPQLDPDGMTGIGRGVLAAEGLFDTGRGWMETAAKLGLPPPFGVFGLVVMTDGVENRTPMVADVASTLTANSFAIGIGRPQNISVAALSTLTLGHEGYLLVTGKLDPSQSLRLNKYILQVLAGITNADVVLDPGGLAAPGIDPRIAFQVCEADMGIDVYLLSPARHLRSFALEAPDGRIVDGLEGPLPPNIVFVSGSEMSYYRLPLPAPSDDRGGGHAGTWHARLSFGPPAGATPHVTIHNPAASSSRIPYDLLVHCHSNLRLSARAEQSGFEPGAAVHLQANLSEYDTPVEGRARMWAEVEPPRGARFDLPMPEVGPGRFEADLKADATGLYRIRMRATGATYAGTPFHREQAVTAAVYPGGDRSSDPDNGPRDAICSLICCLLRSGAIDARIVESLRAQGVDLKAAIGCVEELCREKDPHTSERPSARGTSVSNAQDPSDLASRVLEMLRGRTPPDP